MTKRRMERWIGRALVVGLIFVSLTRHAAAQAASREITGRVADRSGAPLVGAAISIAELGRATTSDPNGRFRFAAIPAGTFTVSARQIGYTPAASMVVVGGA